MTEPQLRNIVIDRLTGHGKIVEEVELGRRRVDILLINDALHAYELKSDQDTLRRLLPQVEAYSKLCETVTVVTGVKHYEKALQKLPSWVGLGYVCETNGYSKERDPKTSPNLCRRELFLKLWTTELRKLGRLQGLKRVSHSNKWTLVDRLMKVTAGRDASALVAEQLRQRDYDELRGTI